MQYHYYNSKKSKKSAWLFLAIMCFSILEPIPFYALSGGDKSPEFESYQSFGVDNMVDVSTGDFSYNIPLMQVGFHGINLFYQAGVGMEDMATSWGLGWNINNGMINRTVRGNADDWNGNDEVKRLLHTKPKMTFGLNMGGEAEVLSTDMLKLKGSIGSYQDNMDGQGYEWGISASLNAATRSGHRKTAGLGLNLSLSSNTHQGVSLSPSVSYSSKFDQARRLHGGNVFGIGTTINSRGGMKGITLSHNLKIGGTNKIEVLSDQTSFGFSQPAFLPTIDHPFESYSISFAASGGPEAKGFFGGGSASGYASFQKMVADTQKIKSYGILYLQDVQKHDKFSMDISRTNDGPLTKDIPNLALPMLTHDIYLLSGPGVSGSYKLKRGDIGMIFDTNNRSHSISDNIGLKIGGGDIAKGSVNFTTTRTYSDSRPWIDENYLYENLRFLEKEPGVNFENAYFKKAGEYSIEDISEETLYDDIGGKKAWGPKLIHMGGLSWGASNVIGSFLGFDSKTYTQSVKRSTREKRLSPMSFITIEDAKKRDWPNIENYPLNKFWEYGANQPESIPVGDEEYQKDHHIGQMVVVGENGHRYIYGRPLYALGEEQFTFNAEGNIVDCENGHIEYSNDEISDKNDKGKDGYYSYTYKPSYVSAYLLTAIESPDYQDRTGNSYTPDDFGDYVVFNYSKEDDYRWRIPFASSSNQATFNRGFQCVNYDDKGSFESGVREQALIHSIRSKNEIACFYYHDQYRKDGKGASSLNGGMGQELRSCHRIVKYSIPEIEAQKREGSGINPEPLKSILFEYDYSLCQESPNSTASTKGKLTLKKLYMLNGKSVKGRLSPYVFKYGYNPDYNPMSRNRWSSYQPANISNPHNDIPNCQNITSDLSTIDFPWIPQINRNSQDLYASAWNLSELTLPSGGKYIINYESDDYADIQNVRASEMTQIYNVSHYAPNGDTYDPEIIVNSFSDRFSNLGSSNDGEDTYVYFEIKDDKIIETLTTHSTNFEQTGRQIMAEEYMKNITKGFLYFKILGEIGKINHEEFEYVPGYTRVSTDLKNFGILKKPSTSVTVAPNYLGFIKLKPVCLKDKDLDNCNGNIINPFSKCLMQAARLNFPSIVYGTGDGVGFQDLKKPEDLLKVAENKIMALASTFTQLNQFVSGMNDYLDRKKFGKRIYNPKSFIRLTNPNKKKIGGGHRVRSIMIDDNWDQMAGGDHQKSVIGKKYTYSINESFHDKVREISTGVAAYEPIPGGDENSLKQPIPFKEEFLLAPDNSKYQETPLNEGYYPAPTVIYSKVTVEDIVSETEKVYQRAGYSIHEHFTYKDFPIKEFNTRVPSTKRTKSCLLYTSDAADE